MSCRAIFPIAGRAVRWTSPSFHHGFGASLSTISNADYSHSSRHPSRRIRPQPPSRQFLTSANDLPFAHPTAEFHTSPASPFHTHDRDGHHHSSHQSRPGSVAFGECEINALSDLFLHFAKTSNTMDEIGPYLDLLRIRQLLESVGESPDDDTLRTLMEEVNLHRDGKLRLDCFLKAADRILGRAPARIVLVVGGPGSGKGALCERLERDCGAVHLSCGEMLRREVEADTPLGREVRDIMATGGLVSSAVVTALMRRRMRQHPGRRILLDGFPRSLENARDFVELCGPPELALHLDCDDCVLLERILERGGRSAREAERAAKEGKVVNVRADDDVHTAIQRLKNYHKHHKPTMDWLKSIRVPIVELDCSGSKEDVWQQLMAIGRLMRPAVKIPNVGVGQQQQQQIHTQHQQQQQLSSGEGLNSDMQWFA
jgi:adenylate kinase